jgi:hypothetical protein
MTGYRPRILLGDLILTTPDGARHNLGRVVGRDGKNGTNGKDGKDGQSIRGADGADGVGVHSHDVIDTPSGVLVTVTLTDGRRIEYPLIRHGRDGVDGQTVHGQDGQPGPMPRHQWNGTKLRFEIAPGEWGEWHDLEGKRGRGGESVHGSGLTRSDVDGLIRDQIQIFREVYVNEMPEGDFPAIAFVQNESGLFELMIRRQV